MLTDKIRLSGPDLNDPEDILGSALGVIFPDDITNQHGDKHNSVIYLSPAFGEIRLDLCDPQGDSGQLFSHFLWNASLQLGELIEESSSESESSESSTQGKGEAQETSHAAAAAEWSVTGLRVLELGAGTGLAGIVASLSGAKEVVVSDYPAPEILANVEKNVRRNTCRNDGDDARRVEDSDSLSIVAPPATTTTTTTTTTTVQGHEWGVLDDPFSVSRKASFDRLLVADCLWMPWQHANLRKSIAWFLNEAGRAWVVAGFHTGREKMRPFYDEEELRKEGLRIEKIYEKNADGTERDWVEDRGIEDITERKRWLVIAVLKQL